MQVERALERRLAGAERRSVTRNASAARARARRAASAARRRAASASRPCGCAALVRRSHGELQLHRRADLVHRARRDRARLAACRAGRGRPRPPGRASSASRRSRIRSCSGRSRSSSFFLQSTQPIPARAAVLVHPADRLGRRSSPCAGRRCRRRPGRRGPGPPLARRIGHHPHDLLRRGLGALAEVDGVAVALRHLPAVGAEDLRRGGEERLRLGEDRRRSGG